MSPRSVKMKRPICLLRNLTVFDLSRLNLDLFISYYLEAAFQNKLIGNLNFRKIISIRKTFAKISEDTRLILYLL